LSVFRSSSGGWIGSRTETSGVTQMGDVVFIVLTVAFFALSWGLVRLAARL
jgi:hypothetical protein